MAATCDKFADFNLLVAFCLEEFRNKKDNMNPVKTKPSGEQQEEKVWVDGKAQPQ